MTSLRTRRLSFLSAFLFLSIVPAEAEVMASVSDCGEFFLERSPPQLPGILVGGDILNQNRFKVICQTLKNQRGFVTLYDIENKIPVFSANKYRGAQKGERPNTWYIEPQLENEADKNMIVGDKNKTYNNQAGVSDYKRHKQFNRGHLLPSSYGFSTMDKKSTFTLTNIVPQAITFNGGSWNNMETCVKCVMNKYCINNNGIIEAFVVTGAQPSADNWHRNRINIPSVLWSAFCCYSSSMKTWIASAHWGENVPDKPERKYLQTMTLKKLHEELSKADSKFQVFPESQCPLTQTVTRFYPEMMKNCSCPPSIPNTSAPPTLTSGFITSTSGPAALTSVPMYHPNTSSGPPTSLPAPLPSTSGPATTTSTNAPPTSTSIPTTPTPGPITSTSNPVTSTSAPLTSTSGPLVSASGSSTSTSVPRTATPATSAPPANH